MNKVIEFVLVVSLFSLLAGCGEKDAKSASATTDAPTVATEQVAEPYPGYAELKMKADSGDVSAMYALGVKATTLEDAFLWFNQAADKGDAAAQFFVGRMHLNGVTVPANKELAIEWFKKSAAQGNQNAKDALKKLKA
jgi:TPR repeat protein